MARIDEDELIEHWTLIGGELAEVAGKRGPTRLAFALLLKFYPERVREELLGHCRDELIEPPSANRIGRIISSALHQADTALTLRISARIPPAAAARMLALIAEASDEPGGDGDGREAFAFIKSDPGDVSPKTCDVPFPATFKETLALHISAARDNGAAFLFESSWKKPYSTRGVRAMLARYAAKAGLAHNMPPHRLRHFLFTWLKTQGIDDALIQPYSGHATRTSLEIYSRLALADAQHTYDGVIDQFPV